MNDGSIFGAWIPIWILGAPLALGLIEWMRTPKTTTVGQAGRTTTGHPDPRFAHAGGRS